MRRIVDIVLWIILLTLGGCYQPQEKEGVIENRSLELPDFEPIPEEILPEPFILEKELLYDQHTLEDSYPYKDTTRVFQWDKIEGRLRKIDSINGMSVRWGILQNRKNKNGEAPLVEEYSRNAYKRIQDKYGVERYQGIPLYTVGNLQQPERYGMDGEPVWIVREDSLYVTVATVNVDGEWDVPRKYISFTDSVKFMKVVVVDRTNQNMAAIEKEGARWLIRSMNPATTGVRQPPYAQETPLGIFVVQEKKQRMVYLADGSSEVGGFAPYASRFTNGGYIHGVPVNAPQTKMIEYSSTLGTIPRSHMCVRTATSHAKFIYEWTVINESLVVVFD